MFSERIRWALEENELSRLLARRRSVGEAVLDLTVSNPTRAGLAYPAGEIVNALASREILDYEPDPRGSARTREAVAGYYHEKGVRLSVEDLVLTASTSEGYSFLFKLLAEAGDEILVPRPSYPLFDFLAALDGVGTRPYPLRYDGSWHLDGAALEQSISDRTRAIVAVHPNNPTGSYVAPADRERLVTLAAERGVALIVDEVFLDFPLGASAAGPPPRSFAGEREGLVFVLSGLSKLAGLPQMKLAWIVVSGDERLVEQASLRLEHIGDTYLSVSAPVALAAPRLLALGGAIRREISGRSRQNLDALTRRVGETPAVSIFTPEGGWYAPLRLPAIRTAEEWALELLEKDSVYVHPGNFFGFDVEGVVVTSLLTPVATCSRGMERLLSRVGAELGGAHD
jgi:alanine-synthesizing transaminase